MRIDRISAMRAVTGGPRAKRRVPEPGAGPRVASLDLRPEPGDVEGNLLLAERAVFEARRESPDLRWIVLPELFTAGYSDLGSVHRHAEDAKQGASARRFCSLALHLGLFIAYGFPEQAPTGEAIYDSVNLVGPDGVVSTYRKRHLVETTSEREVFAPGDHLPVVEAGGMRVATVICWDLGFPETVREATLSGADLILAPAGWRDPWGPQYALSCSARALDSGVYVASANQSGEYPEADFSSPGGVYAPDGSLVSTSRETSWGRMQTGAVDPAFPARWREEFGDTLEGRGIGTEESYPREACG